MDRRGVLLIIIVTLGLSILTQSRITVELGFQEIDSPAKFHEVSYVIHDPFNITSDVDFETQGWPGNGSFSNPYKIENLNITTANSTCIWIMNTTSHFVIQNCFLESQVWESIEHQQVFPLTLTNVSNGKVHNNQIVNGSGGISAYALSNCTISDNQFNATWTTIDMRWSNFTELLNNTQEVDVCNYGITVSACANCTISLNTFGNVKISGIRGWSNYNTTFDENTLIASDSYLVFPWSGIDLEGGEFCVVRHNDISNFESFGIRICATDYLVATNNIISNQVGIFISTNCSIVRHNILTDNLFSIVLVNANDTEVHDNSIIGEYGLYEIGIRIHGGFRCDIFSNQVSHVEYGIFLQGATGFNISNNTVDTSRYGFLFGWFGYGSPVVPDGPFRDCNITFNSFDEGGVFPEISRHDSWDFDTIQFYGNTVNNRPIGFFADLDDTSLDGNDFGQLILVSCTDVIVYEGDFHGISSDWGDESYNIPGIASAVFMLDCRGCELHDTLFSNNTVGINIQISNDCHLLRTSGRWNSWAAAILWHSGDTQIRHGYFLDNHQGILCTNSYRSRIFDCMMSHNENAISLTTCPNFTISHNRIFRNSNALYLGSSDRCNITDNEIYLNSRGILLNSSSRCLITQNNVSYNTGVGICLDNTANLNDIYENTFANNSPNAFCDGSSNNWDNQIDSGNLWSDYIGVGPYIIDENDQDNYPLVEITITPTATGIFLNSDYNILFFSASVIIGAVALVIILMDRRRVIIID